MSAEAAFDVGELYRILDALEPHETRAVLAMIALRTDPTPFLDAVAGLMGVYARRAREGVAEPA